MLEKCDGCLETVMTGELLDFIRELTKGPVVRTRGDDPALGFLLDPGDVGGPIHEINSDVYHYHGFYFSPAWRWGGFFFVMDGRRTFRFFWAFSHRFYVRRLTDEQTEQFWRLTGLPRYRLRALLSVFD